MNPFKQNEVRLQLCEKLRDQPGGIKQENQAKQEGDHAGTIQIIGRAECHVATTTYDKYVGNGGRQVDGRKDHSFCGLQPD